MSRVIKIKQGLDINLKGKAERSVTDLTGLSRYAIRPDDFRNITPKLLAKEDTVVKAGTALFHDKYNPEVLFTSPVSGKLVAIERGDKRKILDFVIEADGKNAYESFTKGVPKDLSREQIKENLLKSGCWTYIKQRPFGITPKPEVMPRDIFVTAFDSAPLAPDYDFIVKDEFEAFQTGIDALKKLTDGKIYLGVRSAGMSSPFKNTANVEMYEFEGPHPAGNVGIQINKVKPINKGEVVWTLRVPDVLIIGRLFRTGKYDAHKTIALTGSEVKTPKYYKIIAGAMVGDIIKDKIQQSDKAVRIISGNVLTGEKIENHLPLGHFDYQITAIPEGNRPELFGWIMPGLGKFSISRTFFHWVNPKKELEMSSKLHGSHRAFINTGEMEKVFPMDILPMQLMKAVIIRDIELMEELGIYEVVEEDMALCEVINSSKIEIQKELSNGFDFLMKELG